MGVARRRHLPEIADDQARIADINLVQVRYEMVRRHRVDGVAISEVSTNFGVSRPTFYKALRALQKAGLPGLLPSQRGPKDGHKISAEVVAFVVDLKAARPKLTTSQAKFAALLKSEAQIRCDAFPANTANGCQLESRT